MSYVNLGYKPKKDDLICKFCVEPHGKRSVKDVSEHVAAESSTGTWTRVHTEKRYIQELYAKVFDIKKNIVQIAYPLKLFEYGNIPQILSSIAGNIFGMKLVKNLRLLDVNFPKKLAKSFPGPKFGVAGVRKLLKVKDRPLIGTIIKPKLGLKTVDHARVAYDAWIGGCDIVKDDENLTNQRFNPFQRRVIKTLRMRDLAEHRTGEKKIYMPNVTAETNEMIKRAEFVKDCGGEYVMIDIITAGFSAVQTLREMDLGVVIHAHRAMHAAFTRNPKHGISMLVVAKLSRLAGMDQLHIGTGVGKMEGEMKEICEIKDALQNEWHGIKPVFAVCSGGLHPGHVPKLVENLGYDIIIQMGGGIHGHPSGTSSGAKAARQAVDAVIQGISLKEYAKTHKELSEAMKTWRF